VVVLASLYLILTMMLKSNSNSNSNSNNHTSSTTTMTDSHKLAKMKHPLKPINKILIANRGEIAVRVIQTCRSLGISTVAVFSSIDAESPHVAMADEAVAIGIGPSSAESYLRGDDIIKAALDTKSDAIHPGLSVCLFLFPSLPLISYIHSGLFLTKNEGYGFLSENSDFARQCEKSGIIFIGPLPDSIEAIGDKVHKTYIYLCGSL
jgi:hypothetical protein